MRRSDIEQLSRIFTALGTPTEETWPGVSSLPDYIAFQEQKGAPFRELFTAASDDALDLLAKFLTYSPGERITASGALEHPYFAAAPKPAPHAELARGGRDAALVT